MKQCIRCRVDKDLISFCKSSRNNDGRSKYCRICEKSKKKSVERTCRECGSSFLSYSGAHGFCSKSCGTRYHSRGKTGELNANWKGGLTDSIRKFYNSAAWKQLRQQVFIRDNYTCRDCNKRGGKLEANHIKARSRYPDLKLVASNIETLCKPCHDKKKWQVYAAVVQR